jgi:hypothetical protein
MAEFIIRVHDRDAARMRAFCNDSNIRAWPAFIRGFGQDDRESIVVEEIEEVPNE